MTLLEGLLAITAIHFLAIVSPGPEFVLISREALTRGRSSGFICLAGTLSGQVIHIVYSAFGLAALISGSTTAMLTIQVIGGAYLVYLGITGLRSKPVSSCGSMATDARDGSGLQAFISGFWCDLLNPKATLYYISLFTFILAPDMPVSEVLVYGAWLMFIHLAWFTFIILMLSSPLVNRKFRSLSHWIDRALGGVMVAIGVKLITAA